MKRYIKITLLCIGITLAVFLLIYAAGSIYVSTHKKELIGKAIAKIQKDYNITVTVKDISFSLFSSFPNFSILVKEVDMIGPMYKIHGHKIFSAQKILLHLKLYKLLSGKIVITKTNTVGGNIYIYTDSLGRNNLDNFQKKNTNDKKQKEDIPTSIQFTNFNITVKDLFRGKLYDLQINSLKIKTKTIGDSVLINIDKNIKVKSFAFNTSNGSFLTNHVLQGIYNIVFHQKEKYIAFENIKMNISNQPFLFTGKFYLGNNPRFALGVKTKAINYQMAQTIVTPNISTALKKAGLNATVDVYTVLSGPLTGGGDPKIVANWKVTNSTLNTPLINLSNASFDGYFYNEVTKGLPRTDPNSAIIVNNLSANWKGIPVNTTKIIINDLTTPVVSGGFTSNFNLLLLNSIVNTSSLSFSDGEGKLKVTYKGPLEKISSGNAAIDINFLLNSGTISIVPLGITLKKCTADITAKNSDLIINNLSALSEKGSSVTVWGTAKNTLTLLDQNPGTVSADLHVYSPYLNLGSLGSLFDNKKKIQKKSSQRVQKSLTRFDDILEHEKISITIKADKIKYNKLNATALNAAIDLKVGAWNIRSLSLGMTGGKIQFNGGINEVANNQRNLNGNFNISNVSARELFYAFDNFGMKIINHENLKGQFSANGNISGSMYKGKINEQQLSGNLYFSLKKGALINFEPLLKIQEKIFKNRNLKEIDFAEISNQLTIKDGFVNIPRMQIESTALNLFVEGKYGLSGNTDLRIQVPLSNLKKRDENTLLKRKGNSAKGGVSVYLRAKSGKDGKLDINVDAFGGLRKKNVE